MATDRTTTSMRATRVALCALAVNAACTSESVEVCTSDDFVPEPIANPVTYYEDAKAILDARCVGCHRDDGIAPFALADYAGVSMWRAAIEAVVRNGAMPPWPPDPCCADYLYDRSLSATERSKYSSALSLLRRCCSRRPYTASV